MLRDAFVDLCNAGSSFCCVVICNYCSVLSSNVTSSGSSKSLSTIKHHRSAFSIINKCNTSGGQSTQIKYLSKRTHIIKYYSSKSKSTAFKYKSIFLYT